VHVTDLGADYFQYDEARHELRGERTGIRFQLTDRVSVQVSRAWIWMRKIDLRWSRAGHPHPVKNGSQARRAKAAASRCARRRRRGAGQPATRQEGRCPKPAMQPPSPRAVPRPRLVPRMPGPAKPTASAPAKGPRAARRNDAAEALGQPGKARPKRRSKTTSMIYEEQNDFRLPCRDLRLRHEAASVDEIYVDAERRDRRMQDLLHAPRKPCARDPADDQRLSAIVGTRRHQGVVIAAAALSLARTLDELLDAIDGPPLLLVLDGITDPHNLGACLRVADGAGAHAVIAPRTAPWA
jgi:hypothetical protein